MTRHIAIVALLVAGLGAAHADTQHRTVVVREQAVATLLGGDLTFTLLKISGYTVDIRVDGARRTLKLGDAIHPDGAACSVIFEEISPETRIARFVTDCGVGS